MCYKHMRIVMQDLYIEQNIQAAHSALAFLLGDGNYLA